MLSKKLTNREYQKFKAFLLQSAIHKPYYKDYVIRMILKEIYYEFTIRLGRNFVIHTVQLLEFRNGSERRYITDDRAMDILLEGLIRHACLYSERT